jgi:hypothetical protein
MAPKKSLDWSIYFGEDDIELYSYHASCETFGTKDLLVKMAKALGIPLKSRDTKVDICEKVLAKVLELRKTYSNQLNTLRELFNEVDFTKAIDKAIVLPNPKEPEPLKSFVAKPATPVVAKPASPVADAPQGGSVLRDVMEYLLDIYTNTTSIPTDFDFAKKRGYDKKEIAEVYKTVMGSVRGFNKKEDRIVYLKEQLSADKSKSKDEGVEDITAKLQEVKISEKPKQKTPVMMAVPPPPQMEEETLTMLPPPPPPPQAESTPVVDAKLRDYFKSKGVSVPEGTTLELCESILEKLTREEALIETKEKERLSQLESVKSKLDKMESSLNKKLDMISKAKQRAESSEVIAGLQEEVDMIQAILSDLQGVYTSLQISAPVVGERCATLPEWKTGEKISETDASSDLLCRDDKVCDVPSGVCKLPSQVPSQASTLIKGYVVPIAPASSAEKVLQQITKPAPTCYTKPIHSSEEDLIADLSCVDGMVCDTSAKVCVAKESVPAEELTTITFKNGKSVTITAGSKPSIVEAIKQEIEMMSEKRTEGARIIRPINLEQLLQDLKVKRNVSRTSVAEQVRQADSKIVQKISQCLNL